MLIHEKIWWKHQEYQEYSNSHQCNTKKYAVEIDLSPPLLEDFYKRSSGQGRWWIHHFTATLCTWVRTRCSFPLTFTSHSSWEWLEVKIHLHRPTKNDNGSTCCTSEASWEHDSLSGNSLNCSEGNIVDFILFTNTFLSSFFHRKQNPSKCKEKVLFVIKSPTTKKCKDMIRYNN